jgi:hypothetical protein
MEADDICDFLGYYLANSVNHIPTFREKHIGPIFLNLEDEIDRLSRNVGME